MFEEVGFNMVLIEAYKLITMWSKDETEVMIKDSVIKQRFSRFIHLFCFNILRFNFRALFVPFQIDRAISSTLTNMLSLQ